jgi:hypothetical protein
VGLASGRRAFALRVSAPTHYTRAMTVREAIERARDEVGLQRWYRSMVGPLLKMPRTQWPRCCGGGCEPCALTLIAVAERAQALLAEEG